MMIPQLIYSQTVETIIGARAGKGKDKMKKRAKAIALVLSTMVLISLLVSTNLIARAQWVKKEIW